MKRLLTIPASALGLLLVACPGKLELGGSDDGGTPSPLPDASAPAYDAGPPSAPDGASPVDSGIGTPIDGATPTDAAPPPPGTAWLAFDSDRAGNRGIYFVHPDGSGLLRISVLSGTEAEPAFSPDGTKLAFTGGSEGFPDGGFQAVSQIFVRDLATGAITQLTWRPYGAHQPAWSPDGSLLAYTDIPANTLPDAGTLPSGQGDLYVINADGSNERDLSGPVPSGVYYPYSYPATPAFTRDSKRVLFSATESIYSVAVADSSLLEIAGGPTEGAETPALSWDGTLAIFAKSNTIGEGLYTISSAGYPVDPGNYGTPTLLVQGTNPIAYRKPTWSASQVVAFEEANGAIASIALVTGSTVATLAAGPSNDRNPAWVPAGAPAFVSAGGTCPAACTPSLFSYPCRSGANACSCGSLPASVPITCEAPTGQSGLTTDAGTPYGVLCCN